MANEKVTTASLQEMKTKGEKITALTAYDYPTARLVDDVGIDIILVGDSVSNVILGRENTLSVTMEEMLHHVRAVVRGVERALVLGDMPFMSYQASIDEAVGNAGRFLKKGGAEGVKVEGGSGVLDKIKAIIDAGIPVMGHVGLTPQWIHQMGGYRAQGKTVKAAKLILEDAEKLQDAGVFSLVLECVPWQLAEIITERLDIPTIGCGAGPHCDGQVLVLHDVIGLSDRSPKFSRKYADLKPVIEDAVCSYARDVRDGHFPGKEHVFEMDEAELKQLDVKKKTKN